MKKSIAYSLVLIVGLLILPLSTSAATYPTVSLNHAYPKGNSKYDVVVKAPHGTKLILYTDDQDQASATANKSGWATFHKIKLLNNEKITFSTVVGRKSPHKQPLSYIRYVSIKAGVVSFPKKKPVSTPTPVKPVTKATPAVATPVPVTSPPPVATPAPTPTAAPSTCTPLTNGGNCYEPGEYCRTSDRGSSGIAGDGESITCSDNNGWRWEPN